VKDVNGEVRAVAQAVSRWLPLRQPGFASVQHVGFVVYKAGRFSLSISVSPSNHSTDFSIIIITRGSHNRPLVAAVPSGPWIPPPTIQIKKKRRQWKVEK
jgi:hypothetical protein